MILADPVSRLCERSKDLRDENPVRDGKMLSLH
jgi:hypothetical protein